MTGGGQPWPHRLDDLAAGNDPIQPPLREVAATIGRGVAVLPALAEAPLARVWGGLLDMTSDALPVIERTPEVEGLVVAAGFSGHGLFLGPVIGQILSELVVDVRSSFPIAPFRRDRFASTATHAAATPHG
jgi:sarcosine oxidase subunit beta